MQITDDTPLATIAEQALASGEWWKENAPTEPELVLPTRVLRKLDGIGKQAFDQIVTLLRALDRKNGNGAVQQ